MDIDELIPDPPRQLHFVPSSFNRTQICSAEKECDKRYPRYAPTDILLFVSKIMDILMVFSNKATSDQVFNSKATDNLVFSSEATDNLVFSNKITSNLVFSSKTASNLVLSSKTASNLVFSSKTATNLAFSNKTTSNLVFSSKAPFNLVFSSKATSNLVFSRKNRDQSGIQPQIQIPPRFPIPSPGVFWIYLLSFCPAQVSTCYGCGASVKPGVRIPGPPHDLVILSNMMREYRKDKFCVNRRMFTFTGKDNISPDDNPTLCRHYVPYHQW